MRARSPADERIMAGAEEILAVSKGMLNGASEPPHVVFRVAELTAMSWLPSLVRRIRIAHLNLRVLIAINKGGILLDRLNRRQYDLALLPGPMRGRLYEALRMKTVERAWMASPMMPPGRPRGVIARLEVRQSGTTLLQCLEPNVTQDFVATLQKAIPKQRPIWAESRGRNRNRHRQRPEHSVKNGGDRGSALHQFAFVRRPAGVANAFNTVGSMPKLARAAIGVMRASATMARLASLLCSGSSAVPAVPPISGTLLPGRWMTCNSRSARWRSITSRSRPDGRNL